MRVDKLSSSWRAREGSLEAYGETFEEAVSKLEVKLKAPRLELDWKLMAMKIIQGVGEAEGVDFHDHWPVTNEEREEILRSYDEYMESIR